MFSIQLKSAVFQAVVSKAAGVKSLVGLPLAIQIKDAYIDGLLQERRNSSALAMEFTSFLH